MIDVIKIDFKPSKIRLAIVFVKYYDLVISCDLCIYKDKHLWIRMPEHWITPTLKRRYVEFANKEDSDEFQKVVLKKVFDMIGLTIEGAIQMRKAFFAKRKEMTYIKKEITLNKKTLKV